MSNEAEEFEFRLRMEREASQPDTSTATAAPEQKASLADKMVGGWGGRMALGMASPVLAATQMLGGEKGRAAVAELEAMKQRGMKAEGNEGFDFYGLMGSMVPGAGITKGVTAALPAATGLLGRIGTGAAVGAATSAAQPVVPSDNFWADKGKQIGTGAVAGAALPLAAQIGMAAKAAVEPFYQKGREAIIGRTLNTASGGKANEVATALMRARQLVPGSEPTVGQASGNAGIASLERAASAIDPSVTVAFNGREAAQDAARQKMIGSVARNESVLAGAIKKRAEEAAAKYGAASTEVVQSDSVLKDLLRRPSMKSILSRAKDLAEEQGDKFAIGKDVAEHAIASPILDRTGQPIQQIVEQQSASYPVNSLHYMKMAMDDIIKNPERFGIGGSEARAITKTQGQFVDWLGEKSPAYQGARESFKKASVPVNQMELAQAIQERSINPLTSRLMPNKYANALSDRTAQSTLGRDDATLASTFTPKQLKSLTSVKDDLSRAMVAQNMGGTVGSDTVKKLAYSNIIDRAGIPTFLREFAPTQIVGNLMQRGADSIYGRANKEISNQLAMTLLDPQKAGQIMRKVGPSRYAQIIDALMQQGAGAAGTTVGRSQ